jgi:hypothetical protein
VAPAVGKTIVAAIEPTWIRVPAFLSRIAGNTVMEQIKAALRFTSRTLDISPTVS